MSNTFLVILAGLATAGTVQIAMSDAPADGAAELGPLPICHSRIVRESPSVRLERLAEMTINLPSN